MSDQERSEEKKFKVTDRRQFTDDGERRPEADEAPPRETPSTGPSTLESNASPQEEDTPPRGGGKIDFPSFVLSLAGSAMMHLGEGPPGGPQPAENLEAAKQMIDILEMLQEKTEGNLTPEESQLMTQLLFELQMTFVKKKKS